MRPAVPCPAVARAWERGLVFVTHPIEPFQIPVVLASRSPRRLELLRLIVPESQIEIRPPRSTVEEGFDGLVDLPAIRQRLAAIARKKGIDVQTHLEKSRTTDSADNPPVIIAADTAIVVPHGSGLPIVLGQPPADDSWPQVVRDWFVSYYAGRTHLVLTALSVFTPAGRIVERIVTSEVTIRPDVECFLEWYLTTGEPRGKAGGYAIQGAGSIFVTNVAGSLSNVVGLPLEAVWEILNEPGNHAAGSH